jgi:ubiquinone/menaquinone biosynthesis C-methylase UbiE
VIAGALNPVEKFLVNLPVYYWSHRLLDLPVLLKWSPLPRGSTVLEVGCGTGRIARYLSKIIKCKNYTAVDIDPKMIAQAESEAKSSDRVIYQVADVCHLPFDENTFDMVIELDVLHHLRDWKKGIREIHRVLKPKGKFIARDYSLETFALPGVGLILQKLLDHPYEQMYNQIEILSYIRKNGFDITHQNDSSWMMLWVAVKKGKKG